MHKTFDDYKQFTQELLYFFVFIHYYIVAKMWGKFS
jgi:hypothetical protein